MDWLRAERPSEGTLAYSVETLLFSIIARCLREAVITALRQKISLLGGKLRPSSLSTTSPTTKAAMLSEIAKIARRDD
jgi:hypothetical protein